MTADQDRREAIVQLVLLAIAMTCAVYAKAALSPLHEAIRTELGLGDSQIAWLQGPALAVPMIVIALPLGLLIDRWRRVRLLIGFAFLASVGTLAGAFANGFLTLFLARAMVGFAAFAMNPIALSLLADRYPAASRGRAGIVLTVGQFGGASVAFALGGLLLEMSPNAGDAWRWAMAGLGVPVLVVTLALFALHEPSRTDREVADQSARGSLSLLWATRGVILSILGGKVCAQIALQSVLIWTAPTLARSYGMAPAIVGALVGTAILAGGVGGTVAGGWLADRCQSEGGPARTISALFVAALLSAPLASFMLAQSPSVAIILLGLHMAVLTAITVMAATLFMVVVPGEIRGLAIGVMTAANALFAVGLAPLAVSTLSALLGGPASIGHALLIVCVASAIASAAAFRLGTPTIRSREACRA